MLKRMLIVSIFSIINLLNFGHILADEITTNAPIQEIPLLEHVRNQYLATALPAEISSQTQKNDSNFIVNWFNNRYAVENYALTPREIKEAAFTVVTSSQPYKTSIIDSSVVDKLNIVPLAEKILNSINTTTGKAHAAVTFCHPTTDIAILQNRSQAIELLSKNQPLSDEINSILNTIKNYEDKTLITWSAKTPVGQNAIKTCYFQKNSSLNTTPLILDLTNKTYFPLFALSGAIMNFYLEASVRMCAEIQNNNLSFTESITKNLGVKNIEKMIQECGDTSLTWANIISKGIFASIAYKTIPPMIRGLKETNEIAKHLQENLIAIASHVTELKKLSNIISTNNALLQRLPSLKPLAELIDASKHSKELNNLLEMLDTNTFKGEASFWSYTGRVFAAYELLKQTKNELTPVFAAAGELDMHVALAKLYDSHKEKDVRYCLPTFVKNSATPIIDAKGIWNPQVNMSPEKIVTNDINLDNTQQNMILTGPNTGGKSTIMKAAMINALMAQTTAMVPAQNITITPLSKLTCYMNVSDDIAKGSSLFAEEVKRAKKLLEMVKALKKDELSFVIIDEIFTGTTPEDGQEISIEFAKHLSSHTNNASITATHYGKMAELEEKTNGTCKNYHIEILRNNDNSLTRTYKLKTGPATLRVAFDIIQEEGLFK